MQKPLKRLLNPEAPTSSTQEKWGNRWRFYFFFPWSGTNFPVHCYYFLNGDNQTWTLKLTRKRNWHSYFWLWQKIKAKELGHKYIFGEDTRLWRMAGVFFSTPFSPTSYPLNVLMSLWRSLWVIMSFEFTGCEGPKFRRFKDNFERLENIQRQRERRNCSWHAWGDRLQNLYCSTPCWGCYTD